MDSNWQPTASITALTRRAEIMASIRQFFHQREVMEVDLPVLSHCAVSDPFIDSLDVDYRPFVGGEQQALFLQTSPEYAMKRLLAAGSGAIYQMSKVFRNGEVGRRHNPEFTMLEWYRPGFDDAALMDEVSDLVSSVLSIEEIERVSYRQLFESYLDINPHTADLETLQQITHQHLDIDLEDNDRDTWLNLLISQVIEPQFDHQSALFIYDYPASQAALAKVAEDENGQLVAKRFELFVGGVELANGYYELTDAAEQRKRLLADQQQRHRLQLPERPLDMRLVDALASGIPECAGVALGVDRLVMKALGTTDIADVIAFPFPRA